MAAPGALLFDLDGTLVDSATSIASALSALSKQRGGPPVTPQHVRPLVSLGAQALVTNSLGSVAGNPHEDLAEFRSILLEFPPDPSIIFPGVIEALSTLAVAGHPMAILTNKPERLSRALIEGLGLSGHFLAIVGGDTTGATKPSSIPVKFALAEIGAAADQALLIGDSNIDAGAARSCGIPFLLYEGGYGADLCSLDHVWRRFTHFRQLPSLVRQAFQGSSSIRHSD